MTGPISIGTAGQRLSRRRFLKHAGAAAAILGAPRSLTANESPPKSVPAAKRPNILFVLADDLRPDGLASLGNSLLKTPNMDKVVESGFIFRHAYCMGSNSGAVCMPSRTQLLTGMSMFRARPDASGTSPSAYTFPRAMREAGYATIHSGKYGNSPRRITNEFDRSFDPGNAEANANKIIGFIRERAGSKPLFLYMAGHEPHDPQFAPERYYAMYRAEDISLPPNFLPYHPFDNGEMTVRDEKTLPWPRTREAVTGKLARYYASISYLDAQVGRVIQALKDAGQYENTIVILAGDNGLSLGDHGLLGKQNVYEFGGMHVPLVFAGNGIGAGETKAFAYLFDIFPTVCELVGIPIPARVEGRSLVPVMTGSAEKVRDHAFTAYKTVQRAIRDQRWKLIRYPHINKTQLFDLQDDPHEMYNLAERPEYAERLGQMMTLLASVQRELGDTCPLTSQNPAEAAWSPEKAGLQPDTKRANKATRKRKKPGDQGSR
jgi:arylsulfatase A-like enzyme